MTTEAHNIPDPTDYSPRVPTFSNDLMRALLTLTFSAFIWILFYINLSFMLGLGILGLIVIGVAVVWMFSYTLRGIIRLFETFAYQLAANRTQLPYMNHPTKCQFLVRRQLTFSCMAEQLTPFDLNAFNRCHSQPLWEMCWQERIPSILDVFDTEIPAKQQRLAFIIAGMKEHARPAAAKMLEVLHDESLESQVRIAAGYALEEMKEESAIVPLIGMIGRFDQQSDKLVQSIIARYGVSALPYLAKALQEYSSDIICGSIVEVVGRIQDNNGIPLLDQILNDETTGEFTRMQALYALRAIESERSFKRLVAHLEIALPSEHTIIKTICLNNREICFPFLIELLADRAISETYYERIGDILAEEGAQGYYSLFMELRKTKDESTVLHLVRTLKEHTPENEEEFIGLHDVLDKILLDLQTANLPPN